MANEEEVGATGVEQMKNEPTAAEDGEDAICGLSPSTEKKIVAHFIAEFSNTAAISR